MLTSVGGEKFSMVTQLFARLAERYGHPWQRWPAGFERPDGPSVARFAASREGCGRKRYHAWLQWLCEAQLENASLGARIMSDLAVGIDGGGADAWMWQDTFSLGCTWGRHRTISIRGGRTGAWCRGTRGG